MDAGNTGKAQLLDEEIDEEYEPTQKEIHDYADWLGIDVDKDADLLWIARRGLTTPLPKPWRPCQSGQGEIFYFNPETGENTWDHPCDELLRELYSQEKAKKEKNKMPAQEQSDAASGAASGTPGEANNSICSDVVGNSGSMIGPICVGSDDGDVHESIEILSLGAISPDANALSSPEDSPQESSAQFAEQSASEPVVVKSEDSPKQATSTRLPTEDPPPPPQPPPREGSSTEDPSPDVREKSQTPPPPPSAITSSAARAGGALGSLGALPPLTRNSNAADLMEMLEPPKLQPLPAPLHAPRECKAQETESSLAEGRLQASRPPLPATGVEDLFKMPLDLEASSAQPSAQVRQREQQQGSSGSSGASVSKSATPLEIDSAGKGRVREAVAAAEEAALLRRRLLDSEEECSRLRANAGEAARLRRQLETRVEQAAAAPAAAAPALSALSEELASEAAECRRWRAEGSSRGRDLERLRADAAAEVAAHAQVAADLRAELASARAEAARAEVHHTEVEASVEVARARAACAEGPSRQIAATERSGEVRNHRDFLAPDAPSPPTPELVSILEAELRPGRRASLEVPDMLSGVAGLGQAGRSPASFSGDAARPMNKDAEQSSLWSQLLEDDAPPVTPGAQKASSPAAQATYSAAASSSLDISSLSAILQRSPMADDKWGDAAEACFSPAGADDRRRRRHGRPPGPGVALTDPVCSPLKPAPANCEEEELSALRAEVRKQAELHEEKTASYVQELHQLRMELEQERASASARNGPSTSQVPAGHLPAARLATEGSSQTEATTSHLLPGGSYVGLLDPTNSRDSRAPTLKLEAGWQHLERADLGATEPRGRVFPRDMQPAAGIEEPGNLGEKCRAAVAAVPPQQSNAAATLSGDMELARLTLELKQWREDAGNSERLLHEARVALHKEQASHVATKASMRDSQREVCGLRSLLRSREAKEELALAEVEQCRSELADVEAERQRMQLQLHTRETDLARLRAQQTVQSQQGDAALRHQRMALAEREEIIGGRERYLDEREQLATEAEAMLRKQRSELRGELQRAELAGLRATVSELAAPLVATASPSAGARGRRSAAADRGEAAGGLASPRSSSVPALCAAPGGSTAVNRAGTRSCVGGRRASRRDSSAWGSSDESVPLQITRRLDGGRLDDLDCLGANSCSTSPSGPTQAPEATLAGAFTFSQPSASGTGAHLHAAADAPAVSLTAAAAAAKVCSADELPERMKSWRHELRREHAALEEDRRHWRCEARQARKVGTAGSSSDLGGNGGVLGDLGVLGEVRAALDARAAMLNSNINEYRAMEQATSQRSQSGRRRSSSNAAITGGSQSITLRPTSAGSSCSGTHRRSHSTSSMPAPSSSAATQHAGGWLDAGSSTAVHGRTGPQEEDLMRRWRHVLQPHTYNSKREPVATTPRTALPSDLNGDNQLCARLAEAGGA